MPLSELIKPPQYIQFICIGQCAGWENVIKTYTPRTRGRTISARRIYLSVKILWWLRAVAGIADPVRSEPTPDILQAGLIDPVTEKNHIQFHRGVRSTRE